MIRKDNILILAFLLMLIVPVAAQNGFDTQEPADTLSDQVLLEKQWSIGVQLNTNGWGLKFRRGRNQAALKQLMWELEFTTYKAAKEVRTINPYYSDSKSYFYGKLNYLYFLKGGIGIQRVLNRKPYWGGVQLSYLYYGGVTVGLTKPVYLYVVYDNGAVSEIKEEKYDPDNPRHFPDNIYGRASFLKGFTEMGFYPGIYARGGLEFEFGTRNRRIKSLETGAVLDFSPVPIPIMAYNPKQQFFLTLYLSFSFGKRYNYRGE